MPDSVDFSPFHSIIKNMSPGYGNQIYRKRKSRVPLIVSCAAVVSVFVFFILTGKNSQKSENSASIKTDKNIFSTITPESKKNEDDVNTPSYFSVKSDKKTADIVEKPSPVVTENENGNEDSETRQVFSRANQLFSARKFSQALKLYQSVSEQNKTALVMMGQCYYHLEDFDSAYFYLEKVLAQDRENFIALKFLAFTAYKTDDLDAGLSYTHEALGIKNDLQLTRLLNIIKREKQVMKGYSDSRSQNFTVVFSKSEHGDIKKLVLDILDDAYRTIGRDMNYYPQKSVSVILYNEKGFFDITRAPSWAGGLYDGKIRIPIKGMSGQEDLLRRILFHEYTHAFIHSITPRCPRWINEGLAEYYSSDDRNTIGQVIPLSYLENVFPASSAKLIWTSYKESFSAVSHLIEKYGSIRFRELLEAFAQGKNIRAAFNSVYFIDYNHFINAWGRN